MPELSKCSGRNLLFLQKTQVLWCILNNITRFLYFLFVEQWACHLKCFCCSEHYSHTAMLMQNYFFNKLWQNFFQDAYFAEELRMNSLLKRQYFSHNDQLSCMKHRTWLSSVSFYSTDVKRKFPTPLPWLNGLWYSLCLGTWLVECSVFTILSAQAVGWSNKHAVRNFQMLLLLWNSKLTFQQLHHLLLLFFTSTSA